MGSIASLERHKSSIEATKICLLRWILSHRLFKILYARLTRSLTPEMKTETPMQTLYDNLGVTFACYGVAQVVCM